jgi:hypothetical protein
LLPFALRAALGIAAAIAIVALEPEAHAVGEIAAPEGLLATDKPPVRMAWGLRLNSSVGVAGLPDAQNLGAGVAWRLGLDAEYWLSKNVGVGLQLGSQALTTIDFCPGGCGTARANRFSLAPSVNLRGNDPRHFPTVSLALGVSQGHSEASNYCEINTGCQSWSTVSDDWGPYGSLTGAWLFHPGHVPPGSNGFAIGPLVRLDSFMPGNSNFGWTFTIGVTMGFGVADKDPR